MLKRCSLWFFLAIAVVATPMHAQRLRGVPGAKQKQNQRGAIPGPALRRFLLMSPLERQTALDRLPEPRRLQVEQRLRRLEAMSTEDRERTLRRMEIFESLLPARRLAVRAALQRLRNMPERRRKLFLESEEAKQRFDADELELLRDVSGLSPELDVQ